MIQINFLWTNLSCLSQSFPLSRFRLKLLQLSLLKAVPATVNL